MTGRMLMPDVLQNSVSHARGPEACNYVLSGIPYFPAMPTTDARREKFRQFVKDHGSVAKVAKHVGMTPTTLYNYLQGSTRSLRGDTQAMIAAAYGLSEQEIFGGQGGDSMKRPDYVPVVGKVIHGLGLMLFEGLAENFETVPAPEYATENTVCLIVDGGQFGDFFDGWHIFYENERAALRPELVGKLCIMGLNDGRVVCRWIRPGAMPDRYHLVSHVGQPMFDQTIVWATKVIGMRPGDETGTLPVELPNPGE